MNRRDALKFILGTTGGLYAGMNFSKPEYSFGAPTELHSSATRPVFAGWVDDLAARRGFVMRHRYPFLSQRNDEIKGTGKGKKVFLWKLFEQVIGHPLVPHEQVIGDCVSHSFGLSIDVLTAVRILMFHMPEHWVAESATEIIYAGSRVEAGNNKLRGDGSTGAWAAEFIRSWGVLLRQKYLGYDFTEYSGTKARELGRRGAGVPDELEPLCKLHPVKTCSIVRSWEECRDAVANGYPVAMSSNVGFTTKRDNDGFLRRTRRPWYHSMAIIGIDDEYRRPGALVQNSWGLDWVSGPTRNDQPAGSFWVDASTINSAMKQGDSVAISGYVGYPRVDNLDYILW